MSVRTASGIPLADPSAHPSSRTRALVPDGGRARGRSGTGARGAGTPAGPAAAVPPTVPVLDPVARFPFRPGAGGERDAAVLPATDPPVAAMAPGPELAALLAGLDPDGVSDHGLVELTAAAVRLTSWAHAVAARYAALLAERPSMNPPWSRLTRPPAETSVAGDELAMRLSWSSRAAGRLVRDGRAFGHHLGATGDALARGDLDAVRARVLVDRLDELPLVVALDVQEAVLTRAHSRTAAQLRADVERAAIAVDARDAAARRERARTRRRVDRPRALPDGMAGLWAVLPAADAMRLDSVLGAAARTARGAGDPRTLDQLRADGLVDLVLHTACAEPDDRTAVPSSRGSAGPAARPGDPNPDGRPRCPARRGSAQIRVTVPLSTLMGEDDEPAHLGGYGPVDAGTARALAAGGVWRRLVTDPLSGAVLDLGRTRYRPTTELAEHVVARDRTCARPGCGVPAESCDLDHTLEFHARPGSDPDERPALGSTGAGNLGPLCRRDHRLKTDGGFVLRQVRPGVFEWLTPTGHRYRCVPGLDPALALHPPPRDPWPSPPPF